MDKSKKILLLDKEDIKEGVDAINLQISDLKQKSFKEIASCDIAIAILSSGETVLLKHRDGIDGIVVPRNVYSEFLNWLNENNKSNNTPKEESFLGRILKIRHWPFG